GSPLAARQWAFVAATYDPSTGEVALYQEPCGTTALPARPVSQRGSLAKSIAADGAPFLIGACLAKHEDERIVAGDHFNGKIDSPAIASEALDRMTMEKVRLSQSALPTSVLAAWDFSIGMNTDQIFDRSIHRRHGRLVNLPARAMKGFNWTGEIFD